VTPPGVALSPGGLAESITIVARYREENEQGALTGLAMKRKEPSDSAKQD
jgi:hypothetical protein